MVVKSIFTTRFALDAALARVHEHEAAEARIGYHSYGYGYVDRMPTLTRRRAPASSRASGAARLGAAAINAPTARRQRKFHRPSLVYPTVHCNANELENTGPPNSADALSSPTLVVLTQLGYLGILLYDL